MARGAVVLALATLLGCDPSVFSDLSPHGNELSLNVSNRGTQQVQVSMKVERGSLHDWTVDYFLFPGGTMNFDYKNVVGLKIRAWRTSDGVDIFDETWNSGELHRHENVDLFP